MCNAVAVATAFTIMGCGSNSADDTATDASNEAPVDGTTHDVASDVARDTANDAASDAAIDATIDGGDALDDNPAVDGGPDVLDASPPPDASDGGSDATIICGAKGYSSGSSGSADGALGPCFVGTYYICNSDSYDIRCECPAQTCTCNKNNAVVGTTSFAECPTCTAPNFASVAASCGIPY
jgi:hypothetical protein